LCAALLSRRQACNEVQNHTGTVAKYWFAIDNVTSYSTLLAVIEYRPNTVSNW